jgi:hypothetical protein
MFKKWTRKKLTTPACLSLSLSCVLQNINDELRKGQQVQEDNLANSEKKTSEDNFTGFPKVECSLTILSCGKSRSQSEHFSSNSPLDCIVQIEFPQRTGVVRFIDPTDFWLFGD